MPTKKLYQYKGRLSPKQIADGMSAAQRNARRLADDAKLLSDAGRIPSAASLAILSIEESGKVSILRHLSVAKDDKEIANCWRAYRSHTKKNAMWVLAELFSNGARKLNDFLPMFADDAEHPQLLDQLKQISFIPTVLVTPIGRSPLLPSTSRWLGCLYSLRTSSREARQSQPKR
jgi:AbiV family abortive infection protein